MQARPLHDDVHTRQDQLVAELPRLQRICAALAGSSQEADELVQLTCEEALRPRPVLRAARETWLIDSLVRAWRAQPRLVSRDREDGDMRQAMVGLPPGERLFAALVVVDGTPSRRLARILGLAHEEIREPMRHAFVRLAEIGGLRWARELRASYATELHRPIRPRAIAAARGATLTARPRPPSIARRVGALSSWLGVLLALLAGSVAASVAPPTAAAIVEEGSAPPIA